MSVNNRKFEAMDVVEISKWYESNPFLRMLVNAIPCVGGSIDVLLSAKWAEFHSKRVEDFITKTQRELAEIQEAYLRKDLLESPEFYDLGYRIAQSVISSRFDQTRTGYARVIKSAVTGDDSFISLEELVQQISDLGEMDIQFIIAINKLIHYGQIITGESMSNELAQYGYSVMDCERHLYRFGTLGLLDYQRNSLFRRGTMPFEVLPFFHKLISYLGIE